VQRYLAVVALWLACSGPEVILAGKDAERHAGTPLASSPGENDAERPAGAAPHSNPFSTHALPPEQRGWLEGWVEERLIAGSYVYLRVRTTEPAAVTWVASLAITTPERPHVRILVLGHAKQFHSRRLLRDFEPLLFGAVRAASTDVAPLPKGT
jgi:hypothetical protein